MAGFMAGFGKAFADSFEAQTSRLNQRDSEREARAFQEKMAEIQRGWEEKMTEKRQSFEEKMERERQRWSNARDATQYLQTRERDTELRKQSLFDTGLARRRELDDAKRVRTEKLEDYNTQRRDARADTASQWLEERGRIIDARNAEIAKEGRERGRELSDIKDARKYASTESDRTAERDSKLRLAEEEFKFKLKANEEERLKNTEEEKRIREARDLAILISKESGVPPSEYKNSVPYLMDKILIEGAESVTKQARSGNFKLSKVTSTSAPTTDEGRLSRNYRDMQERTGLAPTSSIDLREARDLGFDKAEEDSYLFVPKESTELPDLQDLIYSRDEALRTGDIAGAMRASNQIKAASTALAIKSNAKSVENGITQMTIYLPEAGYVTGVVSVDGLGRRSIYSPALKRDIPLDNASIASPEELQLGASIAKSMRDPVFKYQEKVSSFAQTTSYIGKAYQIAKEDPRVLTLAGTIAESGVGLVRNIASASDLLLTELSQAKQITPEMENKAKKLENDIQSILSKEVLTLADKAALFKSLITMTAFRSAALFGQEGRSLSNLELPKFEQVNKGNGRPELLLETYRSIYLPISKDLEVSREQLLSNTELNYFKEVYGRDIPGMEIESVEDTFKKYGNDAMFGYNLVNSTESNPFSETQSFNNLPRANTREEAIKLGLQPGEEFIGPDGAIHRWKGVTNGTR